MAEHNILAGYRNLEGVGQWNLRTSGLNICDPCCLA